MHYGIDIGGTKIELAIYTDELERLDAWRVKTPGDNYLQFLSTIVSMVERADQRSAEQTSEGQTPVDTKIERKSTVGIGMPGVFDPQGNVHSANIPCVNGRPLTSDLRRLLSRPVVFDNDANAFTVSEANGGAGEGAPAVLGIILGTGIAGGLCINGELYHGKQNMACEFGHIPLPATLQQRYQLPLQQCGCGLTACMQTYLSGPGLLRLCRHFDGDYKSVPALLKALRADDAKSAEIFTSYVDCLACYLAQLTLMYDPHVIVLGGGLSNIDELYQRLPVAMQTYLFSNISPPQLLAPTFGDSSGVRGAALYGRSSYGCSSEPSLGRCDG